MRFINYMRLFNYMRLIYHISRFMSRKIFIALWDKERLKRCDEGKGLQTGNKRKEMGSGWTLEIRVETTKSTTRDSLRDGSVPQDFLVIALVLLVRVPF